MDMQEMYVGKSRDKTVYGYYAEDLIAKINKRISEYKPEEVFYIISVKKGLFGGGMPKEGSVGATLVDRLKIVSKNVFSKNKPDAFTNDAVYDFMRSRHVLEIEIVGVDGGGSVGYTAIGAIESGFKVILNETCIGTLDREKAMKCQEKMKKNKVTYIHD